MIRKLIDTSPFAFVAAALGAAVFVLVQLVAGAMPITESIGIRIVAAGGHPESLALPIGWAVHLAVATQYALLFAVLTQLPLLHRLGPARHAALLAAALVLGWVSTLVTAPAIAVTVSLLGGQGVPAAIPGLYAQAGLPLVNHIVFFLVCYAVTVPGREALASRGTGAAYTAA